MKQFRILHVVLALALLFIAVGPALTEVNAQGKAITLASGKGDIPTLDSQLATDTASHQVVVITHPPLVAALETDLGKIEGSAAEKWTVSKDGMTFTFTIRKDLSWVMWDGKAVAQVKDSAGKPVMVTANDFEYSIKRLMNPATASDYAYVYADANFIKGGAEFNGYKAPNGADGKPKPFTDPEVAGALKKLEDAVAVKAKDAQTLEVTINKPLGYALGIFAMWLNGATPKSQIEKFSDKWIEPGNAYSYGPYVVSEWKHEESLTMVKNPFWPAGVPNSPQAKIDKVTWLMIDQTAEFNNYEAGTIDAAGVPVTEIDRVKADAKLSKELLIAPSFGTYYYGYNTTKAPFDDARMRRAFSYAVDREALVKNVTKGGQEPARWFSRPGLTAAPTIKDSPTLGIGFDKAAAQKELKAYLDEKKITVDKLPPISLVVNQVEGHVKIAEAIQNMWKTNLGINVKLETQEWAVFLKTLDTDPPQIWRLGWNYDYADASNFARDVFRSDSGNNNTKFKSEAYDKLVDDAAKETDVAKRLDTYRKSEEMLVKTDAIIIPIYWYTRVTVSKPNVVRTFALGSGDERFNKWDKK